MKINSNYLKLPGNYLFAEIGRRISAFQSLHPDRPIIRMGIGDVTRPLCPSVITALHDAVDEQATAESFCGYGPYEGYDFLRQAIADHYQKQSEVMVEPDEIFVSDGSKGDTSSISELFSDQARVAVCDPVYPVYVDSNALAGRAGEYQDDGRWSRLIYLACTEENQFLPDLPGSGEPVPDMIYLCFPNNPTGSMADAATLQRWVDYACEHQSVILYDAAYAAFIQGDLPRSIYEIEGARNCAVEFCSFSKLAGFTGLRLGYTVIPRQLQVDGVSLASLWQRRQTTKFNGASYLSQRAGAAVFTLQGQAEIGETIAYYQRNARELVAALSSSGFTVYGGVHAPYIWLKTPADQPSWEFFDWLLEKTGIAGTPGSGFGPCGEGFFRLTAFASHEQTRQAIHQIQKAFS